MAWFRPRFVRLLVPLLAAAVVLAVWNAHPSGPASAAGKPSATPAAAPARTSPPSRPTPESVVDASPGDPTLIGAGDICEVRYIAGATATARLIRDRPLANVFTLGDNSNEKGTASQYANCYAKTWGRFLDRTHATPGNHDCMTARCDPYFTYFGAAAGPNRLGYYSYDLRNDWHVVVLNSDPEKLGARFGSAQEQWLRADLADNAGKHFIAMWHVPVEDADRADQTALLPLLHILYEAHADIVLNGHYHYYERFAPMSPSLRFDPSGPRTFIVGTGGSPTQPFQPRLPTSEVRATKTFGVLLLTLHRHSYDWQFLPIDGHTFTDSGTSATHT